MAELMDAVAELLRHAAAEAVLPVFGRREAWPEEKAPGEWVTTADRAAEALLTPRLQQLVAGSIVVGEEAVDTTPGLLDQLASAGPVWLLDPLDGTANFAAGQAPFALQVALLRGGDAVAAWLLEPQSGRLAAAERGSGAWLDGQAVAAAARVPAGRPLRAARYRRFLPDEVRAHADAPDPAVLELVAVSGCAGHDYVCLARGELDCALYWRTLAWDHVPGVLFIREAGGVAARLDGSPYRAAEHSRPGLLVAADPETWSRARTALVPASLHRPATATANAQPAVTAVRSGATRLGG